MLPSQKFRSRYTALHPFNMPSFFIAPCLSKYFSPCLDVFLPFKTVQITPVKFTSMLIKLHIFVFVISAHLSMLALSHVRKKIRPYSLLLKPIEEREMCLHQCHLC